MRRLLEREQMQLKEALALQEVQPSPGIVEAAERHALLLNEWSAVEANDETLEQQERRLRKVNDEILEARRAMGWA